MGRKVKTIVQVVIKKRAKEIPEIRRIKRRKVMRVSILQFQTPFQTPLFTRTRLTGLGLS